MSTDARYVEQVRCNMERGRARRVLALQLGEAYVKILLHTNRLLVWRAYQARFGQRIGELNERLPAVSSAKVGARDLQRVVDAMQVDQQRITEAVDAHERDLEDCYLELVGVLEAQGLTRTTPGMTGFRRFVENAAGTGMALAPFRCECLHRIDDMKNQLADQFDAIVGPATQEITGSAPPPNAAAATQPSTPEPSKPKRSRTKGKGDFIEVSDTDTQVATTQKAGDGAAAAQAPAQAPRRRIHRRRHTEPDAQVSDIDVHIDGEF
jgi:hypothetical protein